MPVLALYVAMDRGLGLASYEQKMIPNICRGCEY